MLTIKVEYTEKELAALVLKDLQENASYPIKEEDIRIEVKSKQNYRSEWEKASYRAVIEKTL